jgi:hypothetical protein
MDIRFFGGDEQDGREASDSVPALATPVADTEPLSHKPTVEQILRFEQVLSQHPQVTLPIKHHFAPGQYGREMFIPAGTYLTGAVHKSQHLAVFCGDITVWTDTGMRRLTGFHTLVTMPGTKRVGFAHADTWCVGFFPTDTTDVRQLEAELVEDADRLQIDAGELVLLAPIGQGENKCLE